ncbi:RING-H2 finger protein ATL20-like [Pistacia vera]|uniref:RING-H2 finger protein ATL20-like n=1 Tax=Pistacia vera TaxID=55513 RepID=UPI001263AA80|nr:RING-H2 finger protein ATL20-like [Pistacia vera]
MVASQLYFFSFSFVFSSFLRLATSSLRICPGWCDGSGPIIFPFRLTDQLERCGYPGFELSCKMSEVFIHLPNSSGNGFIVQNIDYLSQTLSIIDPDHCLPKRFLDHSFSLSGSPFEHVAHLENFTFLNCSSDQIPEVSGLRYIDCLSGGNYSTMAIRASRYNDSGLSLSSYCSNISTILFPVLWPRWSNLEDGVLLTWSEPNCQSCEDRGGVCGFKKFEGEDMNIGCAHIPTKPGFLPRGAKYGIIVGVAIPGLLCLIGLGCCLCGKVRAQYYGRRRLNNRLIPSFSLTERPVVLTGLDRPTIESFPKTKLGESRRLPNPNDNTCPICLSEYQAKETLRTIPECNHYFHANCIDEWLKINGTCPLCRNSPEGSDIVTPSMSTSSHSSPSSFSSVP